MRPQGGTLPHHKALESSAGTPVQKIIAKPRSNGVRMVPATL